MLESMPDAFPAYARLLDLPRFYEGMRIFEAKLQQAADMAQSARDLEARGVSLSARGRRIYGAAQGAEEFVDATRKSFEAANRGDMRTAEEEAKIALQYQQTFFNLFNRSFNPRTGRRRA